MRFLPELNAGCGAIYRFDNFIHFSLILAEIPPEKSVSSRKKTKNSLKVVKKVTISKL